MTNSLKEAREKKGLTISELARNSGVTRQTIYNIEGNKTAEVSPSVMSALARALDEKPGEIFLI